MSKDSDASFSSMRSDELLEIEDHGLGKYMEESEGDETLSIHEAKKRVSKLERL